MKSLFLASLALSSIALTACGGGSSGTETSAVGQALNNTISDFPIGHTVTFDGSGVNVSDGASNLDVATQTGIATFNGIAGYESGTGTLVLGTVTLNADFSNPTPTLSGSSSNITEYSISSAAVPTASQVSNPDNIVDTYSGTLPVSNTSFAQSGTLTFTADIEGDLTRDSDGATINVDLEMSDGYFGTNNANGKRFLASDLTGTVTSPEGVDTLDLFSDTEGFVVATE